MRHLRLLLLAFLFFPLGLWAQCAGVTTCTATSNTPTAVQAALNSITLDNTRVIIPAGTGAVSWSSGVSFSSSHPYTVDCGGSVATYDVHGNPLTYNDVLTITDTFGGVIFNLGGSGSVAEKVRLTGCTITSTGSTDNGAITVGGVVVGNAGGGEIDHNHFIQLHATSRQFGFGVVDHNLFDTHGNPVFNGVQAFTNFGGTGNNAWNSATNLGGYNFVFMENNTYLDGFANDCMVGGRYVFRYNTMTVTTSSGGSVQGHATGSTQGWRGCRAWEIYNNFVSSSFPGGSFAFAQNLSGTGVQYNNTVTGYTQDVFTHVNRGELSTNYTQPSPPNGLGTCGPGNVVKTGTVNLTSAGAVTWVSGAQFSTSWPAGSIVVMNGTNYAVVSVASAISMTVSGDANHPLPGATVNGVAYGAASAWDQNRYTNGGPCLDSLGSGKGDLMTGAFPNTCNSTTTDCTNNIFTGGNMREATEPFYLWNETLSSVGQWIGVSDAGGNIGNNRDFYFSCGSGNSSCSSFTGTAGVGSGPLASRPATCTAGIVTGSPYNVNGQATGVAWWETDHNQLDYCYFNGTSNVWSTTSSTPASYVPFIYPHPLTVGCSGASPTWFWALSNDPTQLQACINQASQGDTINVSAGTATWTSGVTTTGVNIQGAGAGRVIGVSRSTVTIGAGSKTFVVQGTKVATGTPTATSVSPSITIGESLIVYEEGISYGQQKNSMSGTVTSWDGTNLTLNVTSFTGTSGTTMTAAVTAGTGVSIPVVSSSGFFSGENIYVGVCCPGTNELISITSVPDGTHIVATLAHNYASGSPIVYGVRSGGGATISNSKRWLITTPPSTVILASSPTLAPMFTLNETATVHTTLSGIKIGWNGDGAPTGIGNFVTFNGANSSQMNIMHDMYIETPSCGGSATCDSIQVNVSHGLIYNTSFVSSPYSPAQVALHLQSYDDTAWQNTTTMGTADTGGQHNFYVESNDFHAFLNWVDNDEGGHSVYRNNFFNDSGAATHGVDTGPVGQRFFEMYQNVGIFHGYADFTTFPQAWWAFIRGGTYVVWGNQFDTIHSTDYGSPLELNMTVMNLNRNAGPNGCWGYNTTNGAQYFAPRQVGMGRVTGTGVDGKGSSTYDASSLGFSATEYAGDSDPVYIWNNSHTIGAGTTDYSGPANVCTGGTPDSSANYIKLNRDYFNGTTPKPGYTPFQYPHPLTGFTPSVSANPSSYNFGQVTKNSSQQSSTINVTNTSGATVTFTGTSISGTNAADFSVFGNTCTSTLANGLTCSFAIIFAPSQNVGTNETASASLSYTGFSGSPLVVPLTGTSGAISGNCNENLTLTTAVSAAPSTPTQQKVACH